MKLDCRYIKLTNRSHKLSDDVTVICKIVNIVHKVLWQMHTNKVFELDSQIRRYHMLAKKAVPEDKKAIIRDKDAKIEAILDATHKLIASMGYDRVTIRDIAEKADVSVGLIYKYFPGGKFEILVKGLAEKNMDLLMNINHTEAVDFDDFPEYMRTLVKHMQQVFKDNSAMLKAMMAASLLGGEMSEDIKNMDVNNFIRISEFFHRFKGVDTGDKEPIKLLLYWGTCVKGAFISCLMYPLPPEDEDAIVELLVDQSLHIWGYKKP